MHFEDAKLKFKEERPFANPEAAMAKLLEIANGIEADLAGHIAFGAINHAFLSAGGNASEYGAAMHLAVAHGWLESHPSGAYVKFTVSIRRGPRRDCSRNVTCQAA